MAKNEIVTTRIIAFLEWHCLAVAIRYGDASSKMISQPAAVGEILAVCPINIHSSILLKWETDDVVIAILIFLHVGELGDCPE